MGGGLAFLNKKGFHTGTFNNQERVWKVEQQKKAEQAKLEEIKRQIAEERQVMDLQDAQMGADGKKKRKAQRVAWLYEVPMSGQDDQDQYLLGEKEATEHENLKADKGDMEKLEEMQAPGALWMHKNANTAQEMAMKIRDDPLLAIRKQEELAKRRVLENPVEMLKRSLAVEAARMEARHKKKRKKDHKDHKGHKKHKKHKKHGKSKKSRHDSGSESGSGGERRAGKDAGGRLLQDGKPQKYEKEEGFGLKVGADGSEFARSKAPGIDEMNAKKAIEVRATCYARASQASLR
jgi:uncharacterized membrane protein YkoI